LVITDVARSADGKNISVTIENQGCDDVEKFKLATYLNATARDREATFTEAIPANASYTASIGSLDANAYSHAFSVVVDPDDGIDEIDEHNNLFQKSPIQIKYIHFSHIDIFDTSDGELTERSDRGEFRLYVAAHDARAVRPSADPNWVWKLKAWNTYEISGVVEPIKITPNLPQDSELTIVVDLEEDDTFAPNDWAKAVANLSGDMNNPNSWKIERNEVQLLQSNIFRFQIHYTIYLDN